MSPRTIYTLATIAVITAAVPANLFVLIYGSMARWYRSAIGRQTFTLYAVIAAFLNLAATFRLFGPHPVHSLIALGLYVLLSLMLWTALVLLIRQLRRPPTPRA